MKCQSTFLFLNLKGTLLVSNTAKRLTAFCVGYCIFTVTGLCTPTQITLLFSEIHIFILFCMVTQILVLLVIFKHHVCTVTVTFDDYILSVLVIEVWIRLQRQTKDKKSEEGHKPAAYRQEQFTPNDTFIKHHNVYQTCSERTRALKKKHIREKQVVQSTLLWSELFLVHAKRFQKHLTCAKHYCKHLIMY